VLKLQDLQGMHRLHQFPAKVADIVRPREQKRLHLGGEKIRFLLGTIGARGSLAGGGHRTSRRDRGIGSRCRFRGPRRGIG
jgi:hypothetical protein